VAERLAASQEGPISMGLVGSYIESSVGIVTGYGLDGWGSNPGKGKIFLFPTSRPTLGPSQPAIQWVPGNDFPEGKAAGA
jgi:hypothetical protein